MIDVLRYKTITFIFSGVLFIASVILLATIGLKPGIDFTGGSLLEVAFSESRPALQDVQRSLEPVGLSGLTVQPTDERGYILRMQFITEDQHQTILQTLRDSFSEVQTSDENGDTVASTTTIQNRILENRIETIGPSISEQLKSRAFGAGISVVIAIILFIAYAFRKVSKPVQSWKYGLTAIVALIHDVVITMGVFVLLGKYMGVDVNIPFVVAMITILGYSVNDTIVIFDRIRENLLEYGRDRFDEAVRDGVKQTLVRSFNASFTTLLVLVALFLFGGATITYFALALIIGIALGTYSSIFLAAPFLLLWNKK